MEPKYPDIEVQLSSEDGNAVAIIARTCNALRRGGVPQSEVDAFRTEALNGDYDHVLRTVMCWVETG